MTAYVIRRIWQMIPTIAGVILLIFFHHQPATVLFDAHYLGDNNQVGVFLAAMFMSLFVIYGFDTASTLAEETKNPRVEAPKAVLASVVGAFIIGTVFTLGLLAGRGQRKLTSIEAPQARPRRLMIKPQPPSLNGAPWVGQPRSRASRMAMLPSM